MDYIKSYKIFENKYENQSITVYDWADYMKSRLVFTQKELDKIKNYFLTLNIPERTFKDKVRFIRDYKNGNWYEGYNIKNVNLVRLDGIHQTKSKMSYFSITKHDDDWFVVRREIYPAHLHNDEYYKCDSIDGLIEYLKPLTTY